MNFNYEEIGNFDACKAAKALLELSQKLKSKETKDNKEKN